MRNSTPYLFLYSLAMILLAAVFIYPFFTLSFAYLNSDSVSVSKVYYCMKIFQYENIIWWLLWLCVNVFFYPSFFVRRFFSSWFVLLMNYLLVFFGWSTKRKFTFDHFQFITLNTIYFFCCYLLFVNNDSVFGFFFFLIFSKKWEKSLRIFVKKAHTSKCVAYFVFGCFGFVFSFMIFVSRFVHYFWWVLFLFFFLIFNLKTMKILRLLCYVLPNVFRLVDDF